MADIFEEIANKLDDLGISVDDELEVVIGGSSVYEIDGAGTKWAPKKGTVKYNKDAFIVVRRPQQVTPSQPNND